MGLLYSIFEKKNSLWFKLNKAIFTLINNCKEENSGWEDLGLNLKINTIENVFFLLLSLKLKIDLILIVVTTMA